MIRMGEELHASLADLALSHDRSMNSEICHAVEHWRNPRSDMKLIFHLLGMSLPAQMKRDSTIYTASDIKNIMIRFTDSQLQLVREQSFELGHSMNHHFNIILEQWLHMNQALARSLDAVMLPD